MSYFYHCIPLFEILTIHVLSSLGVRYGPPGGKRLVYFVDDLNMPLVDKYDTQSAIELMRQSIDYRGWFDKSKILLKAFPDFKRLKFTVLPVL